MQGLPNPPPFIPYIPLSLLLSLPQRSICCSLFQLLPISFPFSPSRAAVISTGGHLLSFSHPPPFLSFLPSPRFSLSKKSKISPKALSVLSGVNPRVYLRFSVLSRVLLF
ncbi:hypothetical protein RJT34_04626 [Clitoria ternatea]|uniref:Uncharacterized protein n=1 Tax=Clitoria ternatea TaxID=43366 RepID=A0AAN9KPM5_CLITE